MVDTQCVLYLIIFISCLYVFRIRLISLTITILFCIKKILVFDRKYAGMANVWIINILAYRKIPPVMHNQLVPADLVPVMNAVWERG